MAIVKKLTTKKLGEIIPKIEDPLKRAEQAMRYFEELGKAGTARKYAREYVSRSIAYFRANPDQLPNYRFDYRYSGFSLDTLTALEETVKKYGFNEFERDVTVLTLLAEISTGYSSYSGSPEQRLAELGLPEQEKAEFYMTAFRTAQSKKPERLKTLLANERVALLAHKHPEITQAAKREFLRCLQEYRTSKSHLEELKQAQKLKALYDIGDIRAYAREAVVRLLSDGQFDFVPKVADAFGLKVTKREKDKAAKVIERRYEDAIRAGDLQVAFKEEELAERFAGFRKTRDNSLAYLPAVVIPDGYIDGNFMVLHVVEDEKPEKPVFRVEPPHCQDIVRAFDDELFDRGMDVKAHPNGGGHISIDRKNKIVRISEDRGGADPIKVETLLKPYFPKYKLQIDICKKS